MKHPIAISTAALALTLMLAAPARGEVKTRTIEYRDGDTTLAGYLAWDDAASGKRPGILVVHEWWGLNDYARRRARMLAELGYVAFALDMYGAGRVTEHPNEAGEWAGAIRKNVAAWQKRAVLGLEVLKKQDGVDPERLAAIGYCFGGATVLQIAYAGANVKAVVSFHGSLPTPPEGQGKDMKARVLACHGAADSFVPATQVEAFQKALDELGADWTFVSYGGARHSFTNPDADAKGLDGLRYDAKADQRSWEHMQTFLREALGGG